jgi:hypothetical protein
MMDGVLDRKKYDVKLLNSLEIISSYFIDIFYNHLYTEAKSLKTSGQVASITEGYKHSLNAFLQALNKEKTFQKFMLGIHKVFMMYGTVTVSLPDCINLIVGCFVPADYCNMSNVKKTQVIRHSFCNSLKKFIQKVVEEYLSMIIDEHETASNIEIFKDNLTDIFLMERELTYQQFMSAKTMTRERAGEVLTKNMKNKVISLMNEKYALLSENKDLKHIILKNSREIDMIKRDLRDKANKVASLVEELETVRAEHNANTSYSLDQNIIYPPPPVSPPQPMQFKKPPSKKKYVYQPVQNIQDVKQSSPFVEIKGDLSNILNTALDKPIQSPPKHFDRGEIAAPKINKPDKEPVANIVPPVKKDSVTDMDDIFSLFS